MRKTVQVFLVAFIFLIFCLSLATKVYAQTWSDAGITPLHAPGQAGDDPNLNPKRGGWTPVNADHSLCDNPINAGYDPGSKPFLGNIVSGLDTNPVCNPYRVNIAENKNNNFCPGDPADVSMCGFAASPSTPVHAPNTCQSPWYVLYADEGFITMVVNGADCIGGDCDEGYGVHIDGLIVNKDLLTLYRKDDAEGRNRLPIVNANDVIGTVDTGGEVRVTIRDTGSYMDPRTLRDWWNDGPVDMSECQNPPYSARSGIGIIGGGKKNADEKEVACQRVAYDGDQFNFETNYYTDKNGKTQPSMRTDANLNYLGVSRGVHCGAVKSQPLILTETAPFDINEGEICKKTWWMGELGFNTPNMENFHIPFAEEMADHWAGTLDAEHMKEKDIDNLFATAYPYFTGVTDQNKAYSMLRAQATASAELKRRQGVLKALLPAEKQDELKCSFIRFVTKKGKTSLYSNFAIEGTKLTSIPCPPTIDNPQITETDPQYIAWQGIWGSKWAKMGLFPNEKSVGDLQLQVCGDKTYYHSFDYPEVFRLMLAANELFKIFSDKEGQDRYYLAHNDNQNLKLPLDKNPILTAPMAASAPNEQTLAQETPDTSFCQSQPSETITPNNNLLASLQNFLPKINSLLSFFSVEIKSAFAQTIEKINPLKGNNDGPLLAQGCAPLEASIEVISEEPFNYALVVKRTACAPKGNLGDIYINPPKNYEEENPGKTGPHIQTMTTDEWRFEQTYPGADGFMPKVNNLEELKKYTWIISPFTLGASSISVSYTGTGVSTPSGPGGGGTSAEKKCTPPDCPATCDLCKKTQFGPSYTTIWPKDYHDLTFSTIIGAKYNTSGNYYEADPIEYNFTIEKWDGTCDGVGKVTGCKFKPCSADNESESCSMTVCGYGAIDCARVHDRTIKITNEVPGLAAIWDQAFEASGGAERSCYSKCLAQKKTPADCLTACAIPSGFLNIFKPKCDPKDPNCVYNSAKDLPYLITGCTTNEKYVFDKNGNFATNPGADYLNYDFRTVFTSGVISQFTNGVTITQKSPKPGGRAQVLFYRLGGMCNADQWVGEKELNPWKPGEENPFYQGGMITPTTGPCAGKTIDPNKYYHRWTCDAIDPEPACCQGLMSLYDKDPRSKSDKQEDKEAAAHDAVWTCDDRDYCYPESCPPYSDLKRNGACGKFPSAFYRKGSVLADPSYYDPAPD